jgi:hypothetical protein
MSRWVLRTKTVVQLIESCVGPPFPWGTAVQSRMYLRCAASVYILCGMIGCVYRRFSAPGKLRTSFIKKDGLEIVGQAHARHNLPASRRWAASTRSDVHNHARRSLFARPSDESAECARGITKSQRRQRQRHDAGTKRHAERQKARTRREEQTCVPGSTSWKWSGRPATGARERNS